MAKKNNVEFVDTTRLNQLAEIKAGESKVFDAEKLYNWIITLYYAKYSTTRVIVTDKYTLENIEVLIHSPHPNFRVFCEKEFDLKFGGYCEINNKDYDYFTYRPVRKV